jgi:hypothetical protein
MTDTWSRRPGSATARCKVEGCANAPLPGRRICATHRAAGEVARRLTNKSGTVEECFIEGCTRPRYVTDSQVFAYCIEHKREKQRTVDRARRRRQGSVERVLRDIPVEVPEGYKWCWGCYDKSRNALLATDAFHADKQKLDGFQPRCKVCQYEQYQARLAENPERVRGIARSSQERNRRRRVYGLDPLLESTLLDDLERRCPLCNKLFFIKADGKVLYSVDHERGTLNIRGLLHSNCNTALGLLDDHNPRALIAAAFYLHSGYGYIPKALFGLSDDQVTSLLAVVAAHLSSFPS